MANYVSSLTGSQIDSVMQKIEQGVPEGWAVGEKNGVPVSSSSVYYHNNAKYYAENANNAVQQANAAAARAEAAVPPSTAGAVFFDRAQTLSEQQKGVAQKNIGAGNNNPNLCDNPFFTVNRRNFTTMTSPNGNQYTVDRWFFSGGAGVEATLTDNGMSLTNNAASGSMYLQQRIPKLQASVGKPITLSILMGDGTIYSGTRQAIPVRTSSAQNIISVSVADGLSVRFVYDTLTATSDCVQVLVGLGQSYLIRAVKLELGAISTLLHDDFPDYEQEVIKCATANVAATDYYAKGQYPLSSNPNLLDNGWFTINQRGITTGDYHHKVYCMDRWFPSYSANTAGTWTLADGVLTMDMTSTTSTNFFVQWLDPTVKASIAGKVVTASMLMADGTIISGSGLAPTGTGDVALYNKDGLIIYYGQQNGFRIRVSTGYSYSFKAVKLEIGNLSTLHLDVAPNPAEELAKCQRYFQRIYLHTNASFGFGYAYSGTSIRYNIPLPVPMRPATVTGTLTGTIAIRGNGQSLTPTSMGFNSYTSSLVDISAQTGACAVTGATINHSYTLVGVDEASYIDISADL